MTTARVLLWLLGGGVGTALVMWAMSTALSEWLYKAIRRSVRDGISQALTEEGRYEDFQGTLQSVVATGIEDAEDRRKRHGLYQDSPSKCDGCGDWCSTLSVPVVAGVYCIDCDIPKWEGYADAKKEKRIRHVLPDLPSKCDGCGNYSHVLTLRVFGGGYCIDCAPE